LGQPGLQSDRVSFRTTRATQRNPVSGRRKEEKRREEKRREEKRKKKRKLQCLRSTCLKSMLFPWKAWKNSEEAPRAVTIL